MESGKRSMMALITAILIVMAVLASFFLPLLFGTRPSVALPDISTPAPSGELPGQTQAPDGGYVRVEVTPQTVQQVIATLERPESYYRAMAIETIWGEGESERSTSSVQVWVDGDYVKTRTVLPSGLVRYFLVGPDKVYLWYEGDTTWFETASDDLAADLAQQIPTYEDVLELDRDYITGTGYVLLDGLSCIYVEWKGHLPGYLERYWVEVESGLLVRAETVKDGLVVYRMTSATMEYPIPQNASFTLPDGTVLHEVSQTQD